MTPGPTSQLKEAVLPHARWHSTNLQKFNVFPRLSNLLHIWFSNFILVRLIIEGCLIIYLIVYILSSVQSELLLSESIHHDRILQVSSYLAWEAIDGIGFMLSFTIIILVQINNYKDVHTSLCFSASATRGIPNPAVTKTGWED
jgi:hypothetical protein